MTRTVAVVVVVLSFVVIALGAQPHDVNLGNISGDGFIVSATARTEPQTGKSITSLDFDGDGNKDLAVLVMGEDASGIGRVYVVFGPIKAKLIVPPAESTVGFTVYLVQYGYSVSGGDLNGDGFDDLVIGTAGTVSIVWGRKQRDLATFSPMSTLVSTGNGVMFYETSREWLGYSVRVVPSVNGDRFSDLIVGAPEGTPFGSTADVGSVYLILGRNGPWESNVTFRDGALPSGVFRIWGNPTKTVLGTDVAGCKDLNGDEIGDLVLGSFTANEAYVVFGRDDGKWPSSVTELDGSNGFTVSGTATTTFGYSVDCGDINGDGLGDVFGGSPHEGTVVAVFGRSGTWARRINVTSASLGSESGFIATGSGGAGIAVRIVGDINGDKIDDLAIGAPVFTEIATNAGAVYVVLGHRSQWKSSAVFNLDALDPSTTGFLVKGSTASESAGTSLGNNPGNIDGDSYGLCDVIAGAPYFGNNHGRAAVVFGSFWPLDCKTRDNATGYCSSCNSGLENVNGACVGCSSAPNMFLGANGTCHSCVTGDCVKCTFSGVCTECRSGFVPSGVDMSCTVPLSSGPTHVSGVTALSPFVSAVVLVASAAVNFAR